MIQKTFIRALCICSLFLGWNLLSDFCRKQTGGFSILKVQSDLTDDHLWKTPIPSPAKSREIAEILGQKFSYLARGGQCFAFVSEDGKYVLKLAKKRSYAFYQKLATLPLPSFLHRVACKKRDKAIDKLNRDRNSYQMAYEEIPELTGILYTHLSSVPGSSYEVTIVDKIGIAHRIDLNTTTFLLQKKGISIGPYLKQQFKKGGVESCRAPLRALLHTLHSCVCHGIFDEDPGIHRNFGFAEDSPLFLDVGRFVKIGIEPFPPFEKSIERFRLFLADAYPELVPLFNEELLHYVPKT